MRIHIKYIIFTASALLILVLIIQANVKIEKKHLLYDSSNFYDIPEYKDGLDQAMADFKKKRKIAYSKEKHKGLALLKYALRDYSIINSEKIPDIENNKLKILLEVRIKKVLLYKEYSVSILELENDNVKFIGDFNILKESFQATDNLISAYQKDG